MYTLCCVKWFFPIIDEWQNRSDCNESLVSLADLRICDVADLLSGYSNSRNNGDRLDQWHIVWYMVTRTCWQIVSWMASSGMDAGELILNGIIAGVGAVLGFLPQLIILFLCLSFLEDCGYMARIAFVMDRLFRKFGLSGKSFIPMLIATGCGVPGVMASRTIENEQDRRLTIMVTTFMPCSAKLPIIALSLIHISEPTRPY